jgi:hypothetical protein
MQRARRIMVLAFVAAGLSLGGTGCKSQSNAPAGQSQGTEHPKSEQQKADHPTSEQPKATQPGAEHPKSEHPE